MNKKEDKIPLCPICATPCKSNIHWPGHYMKTCGNSKCAVQMRINRLPKIEHPKCAVCNNLAKPKSDGQTNLYFKTCGAESCIKTLTEQTNLKKYGHKTPLHGTNKIKCDEAIRKKYGNVNNVSQLEWVKSKKRETCQKNFGVDYPMQSNIVREKSKNTILEQYGVDNISKVPEILSKIREQLYRIDPVSGKRKLDIGMDNKIKTVREKYGVDHYFQTEQFRNQYVEHCMKIFGVDNIAKSKYFKELMVEKGLQCPEEQRTEKEKYYLDVLRHTKATFKEYCEILCAVYERGLEYHLDHIFSMLEGFRQQVPPEIIGSIHNLQIIPSRLNEQKKAQCWITKEKLFELYYDNIK